MVFSFRLTQWLEKLWLKIVDVIDVNIKIGWIIVTEVSAVYTNLVTSNVSYQESSAMMLPGQQSEEYSIIS